MDKGRFAELEVVHICLRMKCEPGSFRESFKLAFLCFHMAGVRGEPGG